jgi:hypothetical protein
LENPLSKQKKDYEIYSAEFSHPSPGEPVDVVTNRLLRVAGTAPTSYETVKVLAYKAGEAIDDEPPTQAVEAFRSGMLFYCGSVPINNNTPVVNGETLVVAGWQSEYGSWSPLPSVSCVANDTLKVVVRAEYCVHFAWATGSTTIQMQGPNVPGRAKPQEKELNFDHHPVEIFVPSGKNTLTFSVNSTTRWGHCGTTACESDENGKVKPDGTVKNFTTHAKYSDAVYNSEHIPSIKTNLCHLVGYWCGDTPPTVADADRIVIYGSQPNWPVPPGCTRLYLGFHDGVEWNNNHGTCEVDLDWD